MGEIGRAPGHLSARGLGRVRRFIRSAQPKTFIFKALSGSGSDLVNP